MHKYFRRSLVTPKKCGTGHRWELESAPSNFLLCDAFSCRKRSAAALGPAPELQPSSRAQPAALTHAYARESPAADQPPDAPSRHPVALGSTVEHGAPVKPCDETAAAMSGPRTLANSFCTDYLSHLAAVEVQSIMRWLDIQARLSLARCSRFLLRCASAPFAWNAGPEHEPSDAELHHALAVFQLGNIERYVHSLALRFAPLRFQFQLEKKGPYFLALNKLFNWHSLDLQEYMSASRDPPLDEFFVYPLCSLFGSSTCPI
jgi:hypothetical protein